MAAPSYRVPAVDEQTEAPPGQATAGRFGVVCLSPQPWAIDLPTNRQQIMRRVAAAGHPVLYVETGTFAGRYLRRLFRTEQVAEGIRVLPAPNLVPWGHRLRPAAWVNARLTARAIRRALGAGAEPVVLWLYDPCFADAIGRVGERFAVYDCVDDYAEQTGADTRKRAFVSSSDAAAAARSRLVFATATPLVERHRVHNPRTHLVRNVGDFGHFAHAADPALAPPELAGLDRPVIGFAGNFLASKVDFALLDEVAARRPDWTLVLLGPARADTEEQLARVAARPNVHRVGHRPYAELPSYVAGFDVALIPYLENAYTRSCFPLKTFEYLAAGKPVVAAGLPELRGMEPHVVVADGAEAFVAAVEDALARRSEADVAARQRLAAANTWETRTGRLLELVAAEL